MSNLYELYSNEIFYDRDLEAADPDKVRALYVAYQSSFKSYAGYFNLRYLSYCHAFPDWESLSRLINLEHFSCDRPYSSPPKPLIELLKNNVGLLELKLSDIQSPMAGDFDKIDIFTKLRYLSIFKVPFPDFPLEICNLENLEELRLDETSLKNVPTKIGNLRKLKSISLVNCQLSFFPPGLENLRELEVLDLSNNPIREIPASIEYMTNLRKINISNCELGSIPESIASLPRILSIDATRNVFTHLPASLKKLKSKIKIELEFKALYDKSAKEKLQQLGKKSAKFYDLSFKLMVVQKLMYEEKLLQPIFDVYEFVKNYTPRKIDIEGDEAYEVIPEVQTYFEKLEVPMTLLDGIEALEADGGDEIYSQLSPQWSGEQDYFDIKSAEDAKLLPNLKRIYSPFLSKLSVVQLEKMGIEVET